jgi:type I restriction enzyme R subunit
VNGDQEAFGPDGTLGRNSERDVALTGHLEAAIRRLRPDLPDRVVGDAIATLTRSDFSRSTAQHNREFYRVIRDGVPMIDFRNPQNNRFVAVRELKIQGLRSPHYNRRADIVCFVNGMLAKERLLDLVYENRGERLGITVSDLNDKIAEKIEEAENLAGKIYNFGFQQAASGAGFRGSSAA